MTTCHRLTHRHKAFTLDTYEHNQRWRYGAAMAVDKVSSDGVELSCVASDKVAKTFRLGRSMAATLTRKEAAAMAQKVFCKAEFMRGYFFGRRWRTNS